MKKSLEPGEKVKISGQYKVKRKNGNLSNEEITLVSGKKTPPTPKPGQKLVLVDRTKHKKRKG